MKSTDITNKFNNGSSIQVSQKAMTAIKHEAVKWKSSFILLQMCFPYSNVSAVNPIITMLEFGIFVQVNNYHGSSGLLCYYLSFE